MALAFGSDLLIGKKPKGIHRYDHPIRARVISGGSVERMQAMRTILEEYARSVPSLALSVVAADAPADVEIRLIDEKNFRAALRTAFGVKIANAFVARTNPQCMSSVKSNADGAILHSLSFVIVDQGEDVFRDCAYHELLHAFGLPNHDQGNPWTMLNQTRTVGYLTVYDRALLTLLYDPRLRPGMTRRQARAALPGVIEGLGLAGAGGRAP